MDLALRVEYPPYLWEFKHIEIPSSTFEVGRFCGSWERSSRRHRLLAPLEIMVDYSMWDNSHFFSTLKSYLIPSSDPVSTTANLSISDGAFWAIYSSMTSTFLVPLIIFMLGSDAPIGYLLGFPVLLVPLAQFLSQRISRKISDLKKLTITITVFDRTLWIPIIFLLFIHGYTLRISLFMVLLSLRMFFASFSGTTWTLWVPTVIPENKRTTYFSKRNFVMMMFSLVGYLFALGIFLRISVEIIAFLAVFLIGSVIFSSLSLIVMSRIPSFSLQPEERARTVRVSSSFLSYILFSIFWFFGFSMVLPYFQLYIISPSFLGFDNAFYTAIFIVISLTAIIFQLIWGRIATIYGNRNTILLSGIIFIFSPLALFLLHSPGLIFLPAILYGIGQSGAALSIFNEMISRSAGSRIKSVSYYNLAQALSAAAGPAFANFIFDATFFRIISVFTIAIVSILVSLLILSISNKLINVQKSRGESSQ